MSTDIKRIGSQAAVVALGVIFAGFVMHVFGTLPLVSQARAGFVGK